jgi:hypothetical protein
MSTPCSSSEWRIRIDPTGHRSMEVALELSRRLAVVIEPSIADELVTLMAEAPRRSERDRSAPAGDSESWFELLLKAKRGDRQAIERLWRRDECTFAALKDLLGQKSRVASSKV